MNLHDQNFLFAGVIRKYFLCNLYCKTKNSSYACARPCHDRGNDGILLKENILAACLHLYISELFLGTDPGMVLSLPVYSMHWELFHDFKKQVLTAFKNCMTACDQQQMRSRKVSSGKIDFSTDSRMWTPPKKDAARSPPAVSTICS